MKHKEKKEKSRGKLLLSLFIIITMVSGTIGFIFGFRGNSNDVTDNNGVPINSQSFDYNGHKFVKTQYGYSLNYNGILIPIDHLPQDVKDIELPVINMNYNKFYVAFDPTERDINMDYPMNKLLNILKIKGLNSFVACVNEKECPDIPIVNCNSDYKVFYFKKSEENKILEQDSCTIIQGDAFTVGKFVDRINYWLLGVQ